LLLRDATKAERQSAEDLIGQPGGLQAAIESIVNGAELNRILE
jgi:hypothetical protein